MVHAVELADDLEPWERQPNEPDPAWQIFVVYRDLEKRSIVRAVHELGLVVGYKSTAEKFCKQFQWRHRVEAWDRERDRLKREDILKNESKHRAENLVGMKTTAESLWKLAAQGLSQWHLYMKDYVTRQGSGVRRKPPIAPRDIEALASTGVKLQQLLDGKPDGITQIEGGAWTDLVRLAEKGEKKAEKESKKADDKKAVG